MVRAFVVAVLWTTALCYSSLSIEKDLEKLERDVKLDVHFPLFGKKKPAQPEKPLATSGKADQAEGEIGENWDCYGIQWKIPSIAAGFPKVSDQTKYRQIWKETAEAQGTCSSDFDLKTSKIPRGLCDKVPIEILAYYLQQTERCFDRVDGNMKFTKFNLPTPISDCPYSVVKRMYIATERNTHPKGIIANSLWDNKSWIVIRCTDEPSDWKTTNFKFSPQPFIVNGVNYGDVHKGFFEAFKDLDAKYGLVELLGQYAKEGRSLNFVGLSLGGAVATVLGGGVALSLPNAEVNVYTFGAPRVGTEKFAKAFDGRVKESRRIVTETKCSGFRGGRLSIPDVVTTVPPARWQKEGSTAAFLGTHSERLIDEVKDDLSDAATSLVKGAVIGAVGLFKPFKHVKGYEAWTTPAALADLLPSGRCEGALDANKAATAAHGYYWPTIEAIRFPAFLKKNDLC